ncbi:uncharacterized protein [Dermacentor albipictus]|uniref:uncharacterized protein n=1 Tax=Dermacentor albipictus TaxID=60249 RepID=UPI0038FD348D
MAAGQRPARHTLSGFSPEYDWRPTEFEDPLDVDRYCALCLVLPRGTARLGCSHVLCEPCYMASLENGQRCPIDDAAYAEGEVQWLSTRPQELESMRVKCWNAKHGCPFVGTLSDLPAHYCQKCRFHTISCDRCLVEVPRSSVRDHRNTCTSHDHGLESQEGGGATASDVVKTAGDSEKLRGLSLAEVADFQYSLETKLNSLVEHIHGREATGVSNSELVTAAVSLLRSVGLLSLSATWRPQGLAVVVSRVRYFTRQVPEYAEEVYSAPSNVCGYSLRLGVRCERKLVSPTKSSSDEDNKEDLVLRFKVQLCPAANNSALQWPFRKSLTLSVIHPQDSTKEVRFFHNTSMMASEPSFQMPRCAENPPFTVGGPLHVSALAGCQYWSYGTLQLRLSMSLSSGGQHEESND